MSPIVRRLVTVATVLLGVALAVLWWRYVFPSAPPYTLHSRFNVRKGERILIFAPHSDDETLGAGGLIHRAVQAGAVMRVVLVTNGDGFTLAAEDQFHSVHLTPEKYIQLAYIRQKESLAALKLLGVPPRAITFLGFPDRGTAAEWEDHWALTSPYTSRYTRLSHSPYNNSYVRNAPFSGAQLSAEIIRIIRDFDPETIILPHPNDAHPDHWATHNFVLYALATLGELGPGSAGGGRRPPRLLNYLVHRGNWPRPKGYVPRVELVPPPRLMSVGTKWGAFPLSGEETLEKYQAILKYRSQVAVMRRYLVSFARANDLFGVLPPTPVVGGHLATVVVDPVEDTLGREAEGGADLRGIELRADRDHLYYRLDLRRPASPFVVYTLHLHALPASPETAPLRTDLQLRQVNGRWTAFRVEGRVRTPEPKYDVVVDKSALMVRLPRETTGPLRRFFVAADTFLGRPLDRTAWRYVELEKEVSRP